MVVFQGRSYRGFVGGHAGQCGSTQFYTLMLLPVVPLKGTWLVNEVTGAGHDMKLSGKSVAAAYARSWGPIVAAITPFAGGLGMMLAGLAAVATCWTWRWRFVFDKRAQKRLAMNQLALGTGCDPAMMSAAYANEVRAAVDERWRSDGTGGSPGDVARFGTDDARCSAAAYGVLRMSVLGLPPSERAAVESEATRILDDVRELPPGIAHPYREREVAIAAIADTREDSERLRDYEESPLVPIATTRLARLLGDELHRFGFAPLPFDPQVLDVEIEQVLLRRSLNGRHVMVHLRAPKSQVPVHANAFAKHRRADDLTSLSQLLLPSLGTRVHLSWWAPVSIHLVWSGGGILDRAREIRRALVSSDTKLNLHSIAVADLAAKQSFVVRTKMRRISTQIVDAIARCVGEASG
ncbi:MAG TPA: hypothetical protein VGO00_28670 [Kofleriaceae bacterium]|jgi:hypothetical protein|nr:hypothetical protein [Kofleriaceae bacterium]